MVDTRDLVREITVTLAPLLHPEVDESILSSQLRNVGREGSMDQDQNALAPVSARESGRTSFI